MSSLVFPAPSVQQFGVAWPIRKTPVWNTIVQKPASGRGELRIALQNYPRWQFDLDVSYLKGDATLPTSYFATLVGFYLQAQGQCADWLYTDPYDNRINGDQFGTGDGTTVAFQLFRQLGGFADIIQNLNGAPAIFVAGVNTTPASISATGLVTFSAAPANGAALTWYGNFYYRCRFSEDSISLQEDLYQIWSCNGLKFISVIL